MVNSTIQKLVYTNLDFLKSEVLPLIESDYLRLSATEVLERVRESLSLVMSDKSNDVKAVWVNLSSDPDLVNAFKGLLLDNIKKIEDEKVKELLTLLVNPVVETVSALTDGNKPDKDQLSKIWKEFSQSPELLLFALSNVEWLIKKVIKDESVVKWIVKLINTFKA